MTRLFFLLSSGSNKVSLGQNIQVKLHGTNMMWKRHIMGLAIS